MGGFRTAMTDRWIEPLGLIAGPAAFHAVAQGAALPLQGGTLAFAFARLIEDGRGLAVLPIGAVPEAWQDALHALALKPVAFAGLPTDRALIMGILNVTPDSFSDGGRHEAADAAIAAGHAMLEAGADLLDIGGESTRPGAAPVAPEIEQARILPAIRELAKAATISVDTRHAATMRAALEAGAEIVNDISALRHDPEAAGVLKRAGAAVILMHMLGDDPRHMQDDPRYDDVTLEVARFLRDRVETAEALGIPRGRIAVDPGIGFGKTVAQNVELLDRLPLLAGIGCRIVLGASRKGFLGKLTGETVAARRVAASVAAALAGAMRGAAILRVHDVAETAQALAVWRATMEGVTGAE